MNKQKQEILIKAIRNIILMNSAMREMVLQLQVYLAEEENER